MYHATVKSPSERRTGPLYEAWWEGKNAKVTVLRSRYLPWWYVVRDEPSISKMFPTFEEAINFADRTARG